LGYAFRTLGLTSNPNDGLKFSGCYDSAPSLVLNQLFTAPDGSGDNLIIGPVGADGYAVSRFSLGGGAGYDASGVLGVFPIRMDVVRLLPRGVMIGISRGAQKIFHLTLADSPVDIADAPVATLLGGPATSAAATRTNQTLLLAPRAMDIGLSSSVIILEVDAGAPGSPGVLRAFNSSGIPIRYFHSAADHAVTLRSPGAGVTYLDMGIEQKGYIYVLSYTGDGQVVDDYLLDIYTPAGDFLSSTSGVAAANFSLDAWRNVYTLNYETLTAPGGDTEPTISQWIPSTPNGTVQ
jgi:hypothetical protein